MSLILIGLEFYVTEIVLQLKFADATFRGRETTAGNMAAFAGYG